MQSTPTEQVVFPVHVDLAAFARVKRVVEAAPKATLIEQTLAEGDLDDIDDLDVATARAPQRPAQRVESAPVFELDDDLMEDCRPLYGSGSDLSGPALAASLLR